MTHFPTGVVAYSLYHLGFLHWSHRKRQTKKHHSNWPFRAWAHFNSPLFSVCEQQNRLHSLPEVICVKGHTVAYLFHSTVANKWGGINLYRLLTCGVGAREAVDPDAWGEAHDTSCMSYNFYRVRSFFTPPYPLLENWINDKLQR